MKIEEMTAVIIAGGKGTRLSAYTKDIPKPMLPICGKPLIEWQIEEFRRYGVLDFIVTVGYKKEAIKGCLGDGSKWGARIRYIEEEQPLGSAGAFRFLQGIVSGTFFAVYGDVLFSISLPRILDAHRKLGAGATLFVHPNDHPYDSDLVVCDADGHVAGFLGKGGDRSGLHCRNCVNAGFFVLERDTLEFFSSHSGAADMEKDYIASLLGPRRVAAYCSPEYIKDMGTHARLRDVAEDVQRGIVFRKNLDNAQKCIFLDRDGTVNVYKGLISSPDQLELEPGAAEAIRMINRSGALAIVVTNQPVVARGMCSLEDLDRIHRKMEMMLGEQGAYLDAIYFCPHHPDAGYPGERKEYKIPCECRKPATGLIEQAVRDFHIDLGQSWFIGDSTRDVQTGKNAGMKTVLLETGMAGKDGAYAAAPDMMGNNLTEAVECILTDRPPVDIG